MKKVLIILGVFLFLIFILLLILYFLIKSFLSEERIRKFSEETIKKATGYEAKIERVYPEISFKGIGINLRNLKLYEDKREIISSKEVFFKLKFLGVIFKRIEIEKVLIVEPELEYKIKKVKTKEIKEKEVKEEIPEIPFVFLLENLEIKNGKFNVYDGEKIEISNFNLFLRGNLRKNILEIRGKNSFEFKLKNLILPISDRFEFNMDLKNDSLFLKELIVYFLNNEAKINGALKGIITQKTSYNIYISSKEFNIQNFSKFLKDLNLKGFLEIDLNLKGEEIPLIYGKIKSKDIEINVQNEKASLKNLELDFKGERFSFSANGIYNGIESRFNGYLKFLKEISFEIETFIKGNLKKLTNIDKNFEIKGNISGNEKKGKLKANFLSGKNNLNAEIELSFDKKINLTGNVSSYYFNLNEIMPKEEKKEEKKKEEIPFLLPPNLKIDLDVFIKEFIQENNLLKNVKFKLRGEENIIKIENFKGEAFNGKIEGNFTLKKGSLFLFMDINASDINLKYLLPNLKFIPFKINGTLNINSKTFMDIENILETLDSENLSFIINGYFEGNNILKKISEVLKIKELEKLEFERIDFKMTIKKGFIDFPDFKIKGKDFEVFPKGKISLKGEIDMNAKFIFKGNYIERIRANKIFPFIPANIKELPLNLKIDGKYDNPEIKIYPPETFKEVEKETKKEVKKKIEKEIEKLKKKIRR